MIGIKQCSVIIVIILFQWCQLHIPNVCVQNAIPPRLPVSSSQSHGPDDEVDDEGAAGQDEHRQGALGPGRRVARVGPDAAAVTRIAAHAQRAAGRAGVVRGCGDAGEAGPLGGRDRLRLRGDGLGRDSGHLKQRRQKPQDEQEERRRR